MFALNDVTVQFLEQKVLDNVSWHVPDGERVGVVGANGSGKTTLLKVIAGLQEPESGSLERPKHSTFGYLPQQVYETLTQTVWEETVQVFEEALSLKEEMTSLECKIASASAKDPAMSELLDRYSRCQSRFEQLDGFAVEAKTATVLQGLGFSQDDFGRNSSEFSGGWQMRIALSKILLSRPDVLLLDEPTNYLDLEARMWLEEFLAAYEGTVVLVSHDRYFLDRMVTGIVEVGFGRLDLYKCDYSQYEKEREERRELLLKRYRHQQEHIAHVQQFIDRFRYKASKARAVQSRVKYLDKLERIQIPEETRRFAFKFPMPERGGKEVLHLRNLKKSYNDNVVFDGIDLSVYRGNRIAIVGVNGAGKTTLLRIVAGIEPIDSGEVKLGHNIKFDYFSQDQSTDLEMENTVLEEMEKVSPIEMIPHLRGILGSFLFSGDDVMKKVRVLSGGERARLLLAKMMFRRANLLVLDEPTNHLDMAAKQVFEDALNRFPGTVLIVSHDRRLMNNVANKVLQIKDGRLTMFLGNYGDYLRKLEQLEAMGQDEPPRNGDSSKTTAALGDGDDLPHPKSKEGKQLRRQAQKRRAELQARTRELVAEAEKVEREISQMETRLTELDEFLSETDGAQMKSQAREAVHEHKNVKKRLPKLYAKWERLSARLEAERNKLSDL